MTGAVDGCLACELADGRRELPGGRIHRGIEPPREEVDAFGDRARRLFASA